MEKTFGSYYYNMDSYNNLNLPDNIEQFNKAHILSCNSAEYQQYAMDFQEKLNQGCTLYILGIQCIYHNSGIALIEVSKNQGINIIANYEEERYTDKKHFAGYPECGIDELKKLLKKIDKTTANIFCVVYGWDVGLDEKNSQKSLILDKKVTMNEWFLHLSYSVVSDQARQQGENRNKKSFYTFSPLLVQSWQKLCEDLSLDPVRCPCIQMLHHENHAYFSYGVSPFFDKNASARTVMISCIDGSGDLGSTSLFKARGNQIELIKRMPSSDSLGVFYMLCASFLGGWTALSSEGRYMGAAAWGNYNRLTNPFYKRLRQFFHFAESGEIHTNNAMTENGYAALQEIVGDFLPIYKLWNPDAILNVDDIEHSEITRDRVDTAAAVQMVFEDALFHIIAFLIQETESDQLVMCGGTALNCVANMRLIEHFNRDYYKRYLNQDTQLKIWIPPIPSDQGVIPGAAYQFAMKNGGIPQGKLPTPFLCGLPPSTQSIIEALQGADFVHYKKIGNLHDVASELQVADWMAYVVSENGVIGIYQGSAETGPRALGHRSFLANPCNQNTLEILNSRVKLRERIRPLAPMVTLEDAHRLFHLSIGGSANNYDAYDYMVLNVIARDEAKIKIPAVIHYDDSSRIQIVRERNNSLIYKYLKALKKYIGVEVSVNTSLNVGGPIVQTPRQALQIFKRAKGLDALFMVGEEGDAFMVWAKAGVQKFPPRINQFAAAYWGRQDPGLYSSPLLAIAMPEQPMPVTAKILETIDTAKPDTRAILKALQEKRISLAEAKQQLGQPTPPIATALSGNAKTPLKTCSAPSCQTPVCTTVGSAGKVSMTDIAIIGISGKFPDAENVQEFWKNLRSGHDSIKIAPSDRGWNIDDYYDPRPQTPGKTYSKWGGYLNDVDKFDPLFFGIPPREAELMDPSERIFLQEAWKAIEDAGYAAADLSGKPWSVFACAKGDYPVYIQQHKADYLSPTDSYAPARLSYFLNLMGPCISVDTACSSTLAAIAYACDSLVLGNSELAIAGGGGIYTTPNMLIYSSQSMLLSPDGHCHTFDAKANGTVLGEAIGVIILKPLQAAIRDQDHIYGVIKGWGINHDGKTNGMTAPSTLSQTELETGIYRKFGIDPAEITMVEAHGTGTKLGDTVEVHGLINAFRTFTAKTAYCALGSSKANIGHAFFGAGVAGVIKVLMALQHKEIPPSLHFETINTYIPLENSPFYVNTACQPWLVDASQPRMAAISSFGATGINVHLVIAEYDVATNEASLPETLTPAMIALSAKDALRLKAVASNLYDFLQNHPTPKNLNLAAIAYTLQVGRTAMEERLAFVAASVQELKDKLGVFIARQTAVRGDEVNAIFHDQTKAHQKTLGLFDTDENLQQVVTAWIAKGEHEKLLSLWVKGLSFDWNRLYGNRKLPKISLPTYPFAKESYWVADNFASGTGTSQRSMRLLNKAWQLCQELPVGQKDQTEKKLAIISTQETLCLAKAIAALSPHAQILDDADLGSQLIGSGYDQNGYHAVIDLIGCDRQEMFHELGWIAWLQQQIEIAHHQDLRLLCVTQGLESYQNTTAINLAGATRVGLYRMLQSEYPQLKSRHLDVEPLSSHAELAKQINNELLFNTDDIEVAYRQGLRYRAYIEEIAWQQAVDAQPIVFPKDQVLWITGGTRGLGYLCAQHFVSRYGVKRLLLSGRDKFPPRQQWDTCEGLIAEKINAIRDLEAQGADVWVLSTPLTDEAALRQDLQKVTAELGAIGGVIHCAGSADYDNPAFIRKSLTNIEAILAPKVAGLDTLLKLVEQQPLQFVLLFSSVAAIIPSLSSGQSDYAMANAAMDYLAEAKAKDSPFRVVSIQWPSWKETGMGEVRSQAYQNTGLLSHSNAEGLQLLEHVIAKQLGPVVMPAIVDPEKWEPQQLMRHNASQPKLQGPNAATIRFMDTRGITANTGDQLLDSGLKWLVDLVARELKLPASRLQADVALQDYGVDSILLAQLTAKINAALKEQIDPSALFEYPTLDAFAHWLANTYPKALARLVTPPLSSPPASEPTLRTVTSHPQPTATPAQPSGIAVVGLSCRFPGAANLEAYWKLLSEGQTAICPIPEERFGHGNIFYAGLLDDINFFDPRFFLLPDRDVKAMDPQALLVLEESLKVFYHAGYTLSEIKGSVTGVYLGARSRHLPEESLLNQAKNPIVAAGQNYMAANISQFFDLHGPSLVLDTACSSALVGMNLAIQALRSGEISSALVGGVNLLATDHALRIMQQRQLLAPEPVFHIFDRRAKGMVLGEGVGMVLLKTLQQALEDGDHIYALVKALAINNDGRTAGPATPNVEAQKAVMRRALQQSGKQAADIGYIEVNGSGSEVTDLLELKAIEAVYRPAGEKAASVCELGSMKPNIGHPLCAEGIAGFIKTVLMLQHQQTVPFLSGQEPMAHYDFAISPFRFSRRLTPWIKPQTIAINCFADGGTNAHVILESWQESATTPRKLKHTPLKPPILNRYAIHVAPSAIQSFNKAMRMDAEHPVLKNHLAYDQALLPGLAYIDILFRLFRDNGHDFRQLELRNLSIYHPLIVGEDFYVELNIQCAATEAGYWQIEVKGQELYSSLAEAKPKHYISAEMHRLESVSFDTRRLDLGQLKSAAVKTEDLGIFYRQCREQDLLHTGLMKAAGKVYSLPDASLIEIASKVQPDGEMFNPALLDGSGVSSAGLFRTLLQGESRLFLPLTFASFRASELLQSRCYARIPLASLQRKNELLYFNMEFFNDQGEKVAELNNVVNKLVREASLINPLQQIQNFTVGKTAIPTQVTSAQQHTIVQQSVAEVFLKNLLSEYLAIPAEQLDAEAGYYEMGVDSAGLLELVEKISKEINAQLSPTLFFEHSNIAELSAYLIENYPAYWQSPKTPHSDTPRLTSGAADNPQINGGILLAEDIAIIGMAGRYPLAENIEEFWQNLKNGRDCIREIPESRWNFEERLGGIKSPSGKSMSRWGGIIDDVDCFDPSFFRITPREAETLDPQERLFLEVCWEAIEDAGYTPKTLVPARGANKRKRVGVFLGVMHKDYTLVGAEVASRLQPFPLTLNCAPIANRVSFVCDFHGPSMAIDTVCSSSLTTVHSAIQSLRLGECEVALAGGVNLSLHPNKYMTYGMGELHSTDGRCRTFGEGGNGYVSGEGIGAVLLKPLAKAIQDNDLIYAVIKGSAINHVGAVSGFSVPSPIGQTDVIMDCLEKTGINPRTIGYVEAHGTGTALGDPIEMQGLIKAYRHYTQDIQFCAIGSAKSNMGHGESAAGIIGLTKAVLQLYHRTLVPSLLHSETLNPAIDFANSPFYVQRKTEAWQQPEAHPRRAAVSSFGATGSNAHVVLEEFIPQHTVAGYGPDEQMVIVPLSAKTSERLSAYAQRLMHYLNKAMPELRLEDLAYTFQIGREEMKERLAFVVKSRSELIAKLETFLTAAEAGTQAGSLYYRGQSRQTDVRHSPTLVQQWLAQKNLKNLAEAWVDGGGVRWEALYTQPMPRRISLPTYPFAKERYWVPETKNTPVTKAMKLEPKALTDPHLSDIKKKTFSLTFTGEESFLTDHVIHGRKVMPGIIYLEILREAMRRFWPEKKIDNQAKVNNIAWFRPLLIDDQPVTVNIALSLEAEAIGYEVYTQDDKGEQEPIIYSQGSLVLPQDGNPSANGAGTLDIASLRAACDRYTLSAAQCYELYRSIGFSYGPAHQGIKKIHIGDNEVVAEFSFPPSVLKTKDRFLFHPSLYDFALQSTVGLDYHPATTDRPSLLPFAVDAIEILGGANETMWAWLRRSESDTHGSDRIQKLDIDICDDVGTVFVKIRGFHSRLIKGERADTLVLQPVWKECAAMPSSANQCQQQRIFLCGLQQQMESVQDGMPEASVVEICPKQPPGNFTDSALRLFEEIKAILLAKPKESILIQVVVPYQGETQILSGLSGLLKTATLENPLLRGQLIVVSEEEKPKQLIEKLHANSLASTGTCIRYEGEKRLVREFKKLTVQEAEPTLPWKEGGIYLITGGAGGLGLIFATEILANIKRGCLVLTGRSALSQEKQRKLKELERSGVHVEYQVVDVCDPQAVVKLIQDIQDKFGGLNGIIHSAGIIRDNFIFRKSPDDFKQVLAPKLEGAMNLDQASKHLNLDFFVLFASGAGVTGNVGQIDYATANACLDAFAYYRNALLATRERNGQTLAIDWPLWKEGGMGVDKATEQAMQEKTGMVAMKTSSGISAFYQGMASRQSQIMVMEGDLAKMYEFLGRAQLYHPLDLAETTLENTRAAAEPEKPNEDSELRQKTIAYLKAQLAAVIKLPVEKISDEDPLEDYGIDSIMVIQLSNGLEETFGSLPKTLFFEYSNINELSQYFLDSYRPELLRLKTSQ